MSRFIDYLGNPINEGDVVVYPTCTGSSSAELQTAKIKDLIPLVEKPGVWHSTGPHSRVPLVREDQQYKPSATEYRPSGKYDPRARQYVPDPRRHFVLRVQERYDDGSVADKTKFLTNVDRVLVITEIV